MKKILLALLTVIIGMSVSAQLYNNEWIDYSKTYYKFKVGVTALHRISQPVLAAAGLSGTQAQNFQIWKNGQEIPLYTSVAAGTLSATDYLEFYGEQNDGTIEKQLFRYDSLQMCDKVSLLTDTSSYFLTTNTLTLNKRIINFNNNIAGNLLAPENYFIHKLGKYYRDYMNAGYGIDFGELVCSSSFDVCEGWSSNWVYGGSTAYDYTQSLHIYPGGPNASITAVTAGNTANGRDVDIQLNGNEIGSSYINGFAIQKTISASIPLSAFPDDDANVSFENQGFGNDNIVISYYELNYPRQFNFGGQSKFYFELPASVIGKFLKIANFNYGTAAPVLYDITNNLRITGNITNADSVQFVLPPSVNPRKLFLSSTDNGTTVSIANLQQRSFINYASIGNQGNYMIISHPNLFNDGAGNNNVENYRLYRNSVAGGSYNVKVVDVNQLTDQFGFGIKNNPLAIRNFASYMLATFTTAPKYLFLMGRGVDYTEFRPYENDPNMDKLALIPTFGWPASDNLLTTTRTGTTPRIAIGRLSAVTGTEVGYYLDKVKQFEQAQQSTVQTIAGKGWMKNVAQITGAISDPGLYGLLTTYMDSYNSIISDSLFGGKVYSFSQNTGQYNAIGSNKTIDSLFDNGMSLLTYFGHSSPNTLEFNLDNPNNYNNPGKYPLILINGCATGNFFTFDTLRKTPGNGTLSEKYLFANQKGSVGFIANTHLGLPQQIDYFTTEFYKNISTQMYGQGVGDMIRSTMQYLTDTYPNDFVARCHSEEITYHGDPALKLNTQAKPDYTIEDSLISFNPSLISVADEKMNVNIKILNIGKAVNDSLTIRFQQQFPDNSIITIGQRRIKATLNEDTLQLSVALNPLLNKGVNKIIVTIDPDNQIQELSETNNSVSKSFTVLEDEIRPIYPYNYSIVNNPAVVLYGSTASPLAGSRQYVMEMDTSRLFNSPGKITKTVSDSGGIIKFVPGITYIDSTVYYWRVTIGPVTANTQWLGNSFTFINGTDDGYSQSHFYQYTDNNFNGVNIDSNSRKFQFDDKTRKLLIRAGIYSYYSWDQNNININSDQVEQWGCLFGTLQFYVLDSLTLQPWSNPLNSGGPGRFGSNTPCSSGSGNDRKFFEFAYTDAANRKKGMDFFDSIPLGMYVVVRNLDWYLNTTFINDWKADTATLGSGHSLWHKFHQMGLDMIDSFTTNRQFAFIFKKTSNGASEIRQYVSPSVEVQLVDTAILLGKEITGNMTSALLGPAKSWNRFKWNKRSIDDSTNSRHFELIGQNSSGNDVVLATIYNSTDTSIAFINAATYPYLKIKIYNNDAMHAKPTQVKYWMLTATKPPEGGLSPNRFFVSKDTLTDADTLHFKVSFKNISNVPFDSLKIRLTVTDKNGSNSIYTPAGFPGSKVAPLAVNDSVILSYNIPAATYGGKNQLMLDVNPDNDQIEKFHFNNVLYQNFWVTAPFCPGSDIYYTSGYRGTGYTYQWQVDNGSGYANISNDAVYSGVGTDSLKLTGAPTSWYGYKYRCVVTQAATIYYSVETLLKFGMRWTGSVSTAWENPANWSCGSLPDQYTDVSIGAGTLNYPRVNTSVSCRSLKIAATAVVTVSTGANLTIKK
ncbi:MAG: C25 family cysteine peptidase [Ferruginibacter sp.]